MHKHTIDRKEQLLVRLKSLAAQGKHIAGNRVWGGDRCDECCTGVRCDDPTHYAREDCPHCLGTGYALWLPVFNTLERQNDN
jgi:hypothetical protein